MSKRKWITKKGIATILKTYSIRKDEFQPFGNGGYCYVSRYTHGYMISITQELQHVTEKTGRILVTHTQGDGRITFNDIWKRDADGTLQFCFRNPQNIPPSDAAYIKDLEQQISELKSIGQKLEAQLKEYRSGQTEPQPQTYSLMTENENLRKQVEALTAENQKRINNPKHNARGAGRKPDPEHLEAQAQKVRSLLATGKSTSEIQKIMGISRSSVFRYKKFIKGSGINHS